MTDFKLAGIVSAVGLGLGYLLGGRSSKVMEAVQGDYAITYLESHNDVENQHKYYLLLTSGQNNYTAYGRLPGYGREATMKLDKQSSASKMKELAMKKMKTYQLVGHKYDQIPSEIRAKLENEIGMKSSSPSAEPKQEEKDPYAGMNARQRIFMERRQKKAAETFEAEDNKFNWGNTGLEEYFVFVQFIPKRARQMPTHIIYRYNLSEIGMSNKTMCGIYLKGKNTDFNVGWPHYLPLHPEHKSGGCKKCYEIMNNMLNKKSAETFEAEGLNFPTNCLNCGGKLQVMEKKDHVKLVCYDCSDYIKLPKSHLSDSNKRELIMIQEGFEENEDNESFHKKYPHGMMAEGKVGKNKWLQAIYDAIYDNNDPSYKIMYHEHGQYGYPISTSASLIEISMTQKALADGKKPPTERQVKNGMLKAINEASGQKLNPKGAKNYGATTKASYEYNGKRFFVDYTVNKPLRGAKEPYTLEINGEEL